MAGLSTDDRTTIEKKFSDLKDPVTILLHKPEGKADQFDDFMAALEEICSINELIKFKDMVEMETDEDMIHDVEMFPALVLIDKDGQDHGIRFYGVPTSNIFDSFIDTISLFSNGDHGLEEEFSKKVMGLDENKLQVLGTPSVPRLSIYLNDLIKATFISDKMECAMIDLIQFPHIAEENRVLDMPKTVSNGELKFTGVYPPEEIVQILEKKIGDAEE